MQAEAPNIPDPAAIIQSQVDQLTVEIEQLQERLMDLYAKLSIMADKAETIWWDLRKASVCRRQQPGARKVES